MKSQTLAQEHGLASVTPKPDFLIIQTRLHHHSQMVSMVPAIGVESNRRG